MNEKEETLKSSNSIDMVNGPMAKKILLFSLPLAFSSILQQLFNSADVAVVGRFAGSNALAAVGSNATLTALFVNIFVGLSVGVNVVIANYIGQKRKDQIQSAEHTAITFAFLCGLIVAVIGWIFAKQALELISTPKACLDEAVVYLKIYYLGMPFIVLYNFGASILRSVGDTRRPMYCLVVSGIVNVILNLVFVIKFNMGVAGVATATVISNIISSSMVLIILSHENEFIRFSFKKLGISKANLKQILMVGTPAAIQSGVFSISNVCIQTGINSFGANAVAGSSTGLNFEYITYFLTNSFSQAAVTFASQNYGAGKIDRCKKICHICCLEGMGITILCSAIFTIWGPELVGIYTTDSVVIAYALIRMHHVMMIEFMTGSYEIPGGVLRGMGHSLLPALITVFGSVCFRIVWLFTVFKTWHSYDMLMTVYVASWIFTGTMMIIAYRIMFKKIKAGIIA